MQYIKCDKCGLTKEVSMRRYNLPEGWVELTRGGGNTYASGNERELCPTCGHSLYAAIDDAAKEANVYNERFEAP